MSTLILIFLPKYVAYYRVIRGRREEVRSVIRGQRRGVVVSGNSTRSNAIKSKTPNPSTILEESCAEHEVGSHGDATSNVSTRQTNEASILISEEVSYGKQDVESDVLTTSLEMSGDRSAPGKGEP